MEKRSVSFILFGGTGDLTKRKLVPAFASLIHDKVINKRSTIIGVARGNFNDKTYKKLLVSSAKSKDHKAHIKSLNIKYIKGDFAKREGFKELRQALSYCEIGGCNRIYYLATSFELFPIIVQELKKQSLYKRQGGFSRIAFEKPFGEDLKSAIKLDQGLHKVLLEKDVYRIDHYLAKETVQNLTVLKFTNPILESTLNNKFVESIEIIADEKLGVENRLKYYNNAGAIKDMIQSHLLQVLALLLMEKPKTLTSDKINNEKLKILRALSLTNIKKSVLGQYRSYKGELKKSKLKDKKTETFAKIALNCKTKRWNGVDIFLQTGKKLKQKIGKININFKSIDRKFQKSFSGIGVNKVVINLFPTQNVDMIMNTFSPKCSNCIAPVNFEFSREREFGPNTVDEYATLLESIIKEDKTLFARDDVVLESWKIVEKILKNKRKMRFIKYKDGADPEKLF